jgi:hypothetical protein
VDGGSVAVLPGCRVSFVCLLLSDYVSIVLTGLVPTLLELKGKRGGDYKEEEIAGKTNQ